MCTIKLILLDTQVFPFGIWLFSKCESCTEWVRRSEQVVVSPTQTHMQRINFRVAVKKVSQVFEHQQGIARKRRRHCGRERERAMALKFKFLRKS